MNVYRIQTETEEEIELPFSNCEILHQADFELWVDLYYPAPEGSFFTRKSLQDLGLRQGKKVKDMKWKDVIAQNIYGEPYSCSLFDTLNKYYKGKLLEAILTMPVGKSITYQEAGTLIDQEWNRLHSYTDEIAIKNFFKFHETCIEWLSQQGFRIILTGTEYEIWNLQN